jgi:hypothetical protein
MISGGRDEKTVTFARSRCASFFVTNNQGKIMVSCMFIVVLFMATCNVAIGFAVSRPHVSLVSRAMSLQKEVEKQSFKEKLYLLSAKTLRGSMASDAEKSTAASLIENLEMMNPTYRPAMSQTVVGDWELIYTSTRVIRSSPLFQVIRAAFGENVRLFNTAFNILKEPLKITRIGRVTQSVTPVAVASGLETEVALIPFWRTKNTITSTADIARSDEGSWELRMDKIAVKDGILAQFPGIPIRSISNFLENIPNFETPTAVVNVTYVDQDLRMVRDQDKNVFVYTRILE